MGISLRKIWHAWGNLMGIGFLNPVFREFRRVTRPGGAAYAEELVLSKSLPSDVLASESNWIGCMAGAKELDAFLKEFLEAGFRDSVIQAKFARRAMAPFYLPRKYMPENGRSHHRPPGKEQLVKLLFHDHLFVASFVFGFLLCVTIPILVAAQNSSASPPKDAGDQTPSVLWQFDTGG